MGTPKTKPKKKERKIELRVMLNAEEAQVFRADAAKLGTGLSTWARMKLRQVVGLAS